ncbi:MAG: Hsp33 family molecular chaperone HslO [Chitinivibrionia bacterium]|nr:Hsp33 family molecular chaperone HslO [Chitinivibrionia bacterium]
MADKLIKAISESGTIRAYVAITTDTVNSAYKIQEPAALSGIILGNVLTAAGLCAATLKGEDERLSLLFRGNGVIGKAVAEATANGKIRGYTANPKTEFVADKDVITQINEAIGVASLLTVSKDLGLKEPYSGTINCETGNIAADIAYYFTQSEQIPTALAISTIPNADNSAVEVSGGYLIQQIPQDGGNGAKEQLELEQVAEAAQNFSINSMLLEKKSPQDITDKIFSGVKYKILEVNDLLFECTCSRDAAMNALSVLDDKTRAEMLEKNEDLEIKCEFCQMLYYISLHEDAKE